MSGSDEYFSEESYEFEFEDDDDVIEEQEVLGENNIVCIHSFSRSNGSTNV